jgi:putative membrane protein
MISRKYLAGAALASLSLTLGGACAAQQAATPNAGTANGLNVVDQLFLARASQGNVAEVSASQMALTKSKNPQVKQVATLLIHEHGQAEQQLQGLATLKGVTLPMQPGPADMAVADRLRGLSGSAFDKFYLSRQVESHEDTIALYQQEAALGQDPQVKALEAQLLPQIIGHTQVIYVAAQAVGAPAIQTRPPAVVSAFSTPGNTSLGVAGVDMSGDMNGATPGAAAPAGPSTPPAATP